MPTPDERFLNFMKGYVIDPRATIIRNVVPGAEKDRVPAAWVPWMVTSSILNGFFSAIAAFVILPNKTTSMLLTFITLTSINYWRRPEPGWRHILDVTAIGTNMVWHYTLALRNVCTMLCTLYIIPHWMFMALSLLAFNYLPAEPASGWTNKDWSAALWICVHVSLLTIGIILYKEVAGDKLICYDN
jgi:hypothetical protein